LRRTLLASVGIGMDAVRIWAAGERFWWQFLWRGCRMIHSWVSGGVGARRWWWQTGRREAQRTTEWRHMSHVTLATSPSPSTTPEHEPSNEAPCASYSPTALQQSPKRPTAMIQVHTAPTPALLRRSQSPAHQIGHCHEQSPKLLPLLSIGISRGNPRVFKAQPLPLPSKTLTLEQG
jgi:hypothetical protein